MTPVSKLKVCYSENSNDIRSQYANRPFSPIAGILFMMIYENTLCKMQTDTY